MKPLLLCLPTMPMTMIISTSMTTTIIVSSQLYSIIIVNTPTIVIAELIHCAILLLSISRRVSVSLV